MSCNHPILVIPLAFCISHQMLLTSLTPKHMYSYISETNLECSTKIIVPTGYKLMYLREYSSS